MMLLGTKDESIIIHLDGTIGNKFIYFYFIYLFFQVTLPITRTEKLHCRRNITFKYNIKYKYCHKIILSGAGKRKKTFSDGS